MNFLDTFQTWLQGEINAAVAGHASRLEYLDGYMSGLCQRIDELETKVKELEAKINDTTSIDGDKIHAYLRDNLYEHIRRLSGDNYLNDLLEGFNEAVRSVVEDMDFVTEDKVKDKVSEAVQNLTFEVRVS